ncbi:MAG: HipA domain-containing protein [Oscillospiraceae bacterium]|nr:HipA domain-containing protein [Oscillospiraceae bacterium]
MNCLCCGKPLRTESASQWHKGCVRRFFGTTEFPEIDINDSALEMLAIETTGKGYTVPGVQKKLSLHLLSTGHTPRLTLVNYPIGYILKPQVSEFEALPEAEHLVMSMADAAGIATVPHALIRGRDGFAYITRRIDRIFEADGVKMLAMEDFCQLDLRLTQDKYLGSYERCAKIIRRYSSRVGIDMAEFFIRLVFSFLMGNSDMHLKNFSMIETDEKSGRYVLSAAYDLLPVNVIMPEDAEQFALAMNGKKSNIHRNDFLKFADSCGIPRTSAKKMMDALIAMQPKFLAMTRDSLMPEHLKSRLVELIKTRASVLAAD